MLLVGVGVAAALPSSAADEGNLRMEADVTYEIQPDEARVHVSVEMRLTNLIADYVGSDGRLVRTVYQTVTVPMPAEATNVHAERVGGGNLVTTAAEMEDPLWTALTVDLSPDLRFGAPQTIRLSYELPDQPPRSDGMVRASPAYTLFPIYPIGDPEHSSVTVHVPDVYDQLEIVGSHMRRSVADDGLITYAADNFDEEFYATLAARNDDLLDERKVVSGDYTFVLRYTPGDDEWADFAEDIVSRGVIVLEQTIGQPFPGDADMEIIESSSPHAFGYAGWFDLEANAIEVSDQLNAVVMLHEFAHAWFNHDTMSERWLREGLADLYADLAAHRMTGLAPETDAGPSDSDETVVLADWGDSSIGARSVDEYGYDSSWWAMDRIHDDIGPDAMTDVLTAAFDGKIPYAPADGEREDLRGPVDWRRMLDLLEEVGEAEGAREVYEELVVDDAGLEKLEQRDAARDAYDRLVERADGWGAPYELRRAMSTWTFPHVADLAAESEEILGRRDDVLNALDLLGVDDLPALQDEYQGADRLGDVIELSQQYAATATAVVGADERPEGVVGALTRVGEQLIPTDLEVTDAAAHVSDGELDEARAVAAQVNEYLDKAPMFGGIVLGQALLCLVLLPWIVLRYRDRRRRLRATAAVNALATTAPAG